MEFDGIRTSIIKIVRTIITKTTRKLNDKIKNVENN